MKARPPTDPAPVPATDDPGTSHQDLDLEALRARLVGAGEPVRGALRAKLITGGRSNLTYLLEDDDTRWVLRTPPRAGRTPSAHDVLREYRVTSALTSTAVPVARPVLACADPAVIGGPFAVAGFVAGRTIQTAWELADLTDEEITACVTELVHVLAALHRVEPRALGLEDFGRPDGYVERQVALWAKQWDRVKVRESADMDRLHDRISAAIPSTSESAVVHGDYRIDNAILAPDNVGEIAAVVDWEMATLGDPLTDVALMCVYRNPAMDLILGQPAAWTSARLPGADQLADRYASAADRELSDWPFYLALANYKVAVIAEGINHRHRVGATRGDGFDRAGDAVPEFAAAGLKALHGAS